ncbi:MAG: hypothetical protein OEZ13_01280 [Spirochaetia bacterium]|nr:hypothetical protein [Spirochaetia bacterium]
MEKTLEISLNEYGALFFAIPAYIIITVIREWMRDQLIMSLGEGLSGEKKQKIPPFWHIDIFAVCAMGIWGISWGGLLQRKERDTPLTFFISQIYYFLFGFVIAVFYHLKVPEEGGYTWHILREMVRQCWILGILNFIPLPPFDASFFYMNKKNKEYALIGFKILVIIFLIFGFLDFEILSEKTVFKYAKID